MRGEVISYKRKDARGIVAAEDGKEYILTKYDLEGFPLPYVDDIVSFEIDGDNAVEAIPIVSKFMVRRALKMQGLELVTARDKLGNRAYMIVDDADWTKNYERYYILSEAAVYAGLDVY